MATALKRVYRFPESLDELAEAVRKECGYVQQKQGEVIKLGRVTLERARNAGNWLVRAEKLIAHGEWENWVRESCGMDPTTARLYVRYWKAGPFPEGTKITEARRIVEAVATLQKTQAGDLQKCLLDDCDGLTEEGFCPKHRIADSIAKIRIELPGIRQAAESFEPLDAQQELFAFLLSKINPNYSDDESTLALLDSLVSVFMPHLKVSYVKVAPKVVRTPRVHSRRKVENLDSPIARRNRFKVPF